MFNQQTKNNYYLTYEGVTKNRSGIQGKRVRTGTEIKGSTRLEYEKE